MNFSTNRYDGTYDFTAQNTFINTSSYNDLIDELTSSASKNNFYFSTDIFNKIDNNDSNINVDFTIEGKTNKQLSEPIKITDNKRWKVVTFKLLIFIGSGQDKFKIREEDYFDVLVMNKNYPQKDLLLYIGRLRETISEDIFKYEFKTNIIGNMYGQMKTELDEEVDKLVEKIDKPKSEMYGFKFHTSNHRGPQNNSEVINTNNFVYGKYYEVRIYLTFNNSEVADSPKLRPIWLYIAIRE